MSKDTITSLAFAPLLAVAGQEGEVVLSELRAAAGPLPEALSLDLRCPVEAYFSAWEVLEGVDGAVLRAVEETSLADLEIFGFLAMTARNLEEAFARIASVRAIWATGAGWVASPAASVVRLSYRPWTEVRRGNDLATWYALADMLRSVREILAQEIVPVRVGFTGAALPSEDLEAFLGVRPEEAEENFLELPASIGELAVANFDTRLHAFFERECEALAARLEGEDWLTKVRRRLAQEHAGEVPTAARLARTLGVSERSLRRRFAEHDTTFVALRQEVATELSNACLRRGLSATETAFALGYAEPSAFFRAYKGWTGRTPGDYAAGYSRAKP